MTPDDGSRDGKPVSQRHEKLLRIKNAKHVSHLGWTLRGTHQMLVVSCVSAVGKANSRRNCEIAGSHNKSLRFMASSLVFGVVASLKVQVLH